MAMKEGVIHQLRGWQQDHCMDFKTMLKCEEEVFKTMRDSLFDFMSESVPRFEFDVIKLDG